MSCLIRFETDPTDCEYFCYEVQNPTHREIPNNFGIEVVPIPGPASFYKVWSRDFSKAKKMTSDEAEKMLSDILEDYKTHRYKNLNFRIENA